MFHLKRYDLFHNEQIPSVFEVDPQSAYYSTGTFDAESRGGEEFLEGFGGEAIKSPFQDGHYIYTVIGGTGSGTKSIASIIFVADLESPSSFWKKLQP